MKITIVYDNEVIKQGLKPAWGFSALIESEKTAPILFDTGADSPTLFYNMKKLAIEPEIIGKIIISHFHGDHTGGLSEMMRINENAQLYFPSALRKVPQGRKITVVKEAMPVAEDIFSTGQLEGIEQSLALKTKKGIFILTGCSHPDMKTILSATSSFGELYGIAGGFHGFHHFKLFKELSVIYPCHCTQYKEEILNQFPGKALPCGAGLVIELS
jgi:7,8-dihydropterin-6-yl-methyl-4-(beta-D-ribofuranosyl)aminobenzene 5'-phosphate synthase